MSSEAAGDGRLDESDGTKGTKLTTIEIPTIADTTIACRKSLVDCLDVQSLKDDWAEDRLADFMLWDAGVGASSVGKSSLEERPGIKRHVRDVILDLLLVLKSTIDQCLELGRKSDQHEARISQSFVEESMGMAGGDCALEDLKDSVDPEAPALLECIGTADALLNDLVRLGVVIRRAATKSHIEKADSKFNAKGPDLEALNSHLVRVALYRPTHLTEIRERFWKKQDLEFFDMDISEQRITLRHFGVNAGYPLLLNEATTVQKRLIMANLRRSHRFRYSQSHALKLGRTKPGVEKGIDQVQKITSTTTPEVKKADEIPSNSIEQPTNSIGIVLDSPPKLSNLNVESNFSGTTASAVDTNMMNIGRTSVGSSRQSHSEGTAITSRIKTQYPRPPRVEHNLFMCPCCCAPLQRKDSETRSWRKHLNQDLQPYTCILRNCPTPYTFYAEKDRWLQHMTNDHTHSFSYWECSLCEDAFQFNSPDLLIDHIKDIHSGAITDSKISAFVNVCAKPRLLDDMSCPLCSTVSIAEDESGELLLEHISDHIHSFALSSLPLQFIDDESEPEGPLEDNPSERIRQAEMVPYFKIHPYFADSDASGASCGTVDGLDNSDEIPSNGDAHSVASMDIALPQSVSGEQTQKAEEETKITDDMDESTKTSAFIELMTEKRSLEERVNERRSNVESWRSNEDIPMDEEVDLANDHVSLQEDSSAPSSPGTDIAPPLLDLEADDTTSERDKPAQIGGPSSKTIRRERYGLSDRLNEEMVQSVMDRRQFLPRGVLKRLITKTSIFEAISNDENQGTNHFVSVNKQLLAYILNHAKIIFAIVVHIQLPRLRKTLSYFREKNFLDADLPVDRNSDTTAKNQSNKSSGIFEGLSWSKDRMFDFYDCQWSFLAPVLSTTTLSYNFTDQIMPFIQKKPGVRSFSRIEQYEIHHDHFEDPVDKPTTKASYLFAVEEIKGDTNNREWSERWPRNVKALAKMNSLNQNHIVRFITAFRIERSGSLRQFLMFEWANGGDLTNLWEHIARPVLTTALVQDCVQELLGLSEALCALHYPKDDKRDYADVVYRHGNLKPQNILWDHQSMSKIGTLKIGGWAEAKTFEDHIKIRQSMSSRFCRYDPPETRFGPRQVAHSRLGDIWSLGCIYFEFMIWLLYGLKGLEEFREEAEPHHDASPFFEVVMEHGKKVGKVQNGVKLWYDRMADYTGRTALGDVLGIIWEGLLVVDLPLLDGLRQQMDDTANFPDNPDLPTIRVESAEQVPIPTSTGHHRMTAIDLREKLVRIMHHEMVYDDRYWLPTETRQLPSRPETRHYTVQSTRAENYEHPQSLPRTWNKILDNNFAYDFFHSLWERGIPGDIASEPSSRWHICRQCKDLQDQLTSPNLRMVYDLGDMFVRAERKVCDLCVLLRKACESSALVHPGDVELQRIGSMLRIDGTGESSPVLSLFCNNEMSHRFDGIQIGFSELPAPGGEVHLDILREWLQDCNSNHINPTCRHSSPFLKTDPVLKPNRLIDLADSGDGMVRLSLTDSSIAVGDWTVLDYAWGAGQFYTTKLSNLSQHIEGIDPSQLPATFQDAIQVTRALGIRYLWIDAICVVQDDHVEREREIRIMGDIIHGATCVLAASSRFGTDDGLLRPRIERNYVVLHPNSEGNGTITVCDVIDDFQKHVLEGLLSSRGWGLESHALARRTIFFTDHQMYWECGHGVRCETMTKLKHDEAAVLGDPDFPRKILDSSPTEQILRVQAIYCEYSRRKLTRAEDRPLAIQGLEQRILRSLDLRGGFGILEDVRNPSTFLRTLLWTRAPGEPRMTHIKFPHNQSRGMPSWSWMAHTGSMEYLRPKRNVEWLDITSPWSHPDHIQRAYGVFFTGKAHMCLEHWVDEAIVLDDPHSNPEDVACVMLGVFETPSAAAPGKRFYVLMIAEKQTTEYSDLTQWERIGAGILSESCLRDDIGVVQIF